MGEVTVTTDHRVVATMASITRRDTVIEGAHIARRPTTTTGGMEGITVIVTGTAPMD
jgi:hypothetical protein